MKMIPIPQQRTALFPLSYPFWHTISPSMSSRVQMGKFFGLSPSALLKAGAKQDHLDSPGLPPLVTSGCWVRLKKNLTNSEETSAICI